jgi:hypothetical protein
MTSADNQYCTLKRISHEVGWGYKDVVDRLEEKRKVKGQAYHERKVCKSVLLGDQGTVTDESSKPLSRSEPRPNLPFPRTSLSPSTVSRCTVARFGDMHDDIQTSSKGSVDLVDGSRIAPVLDVDMVERLYEIAVAEQTGCHASDTANAHRLSQG